MGQLTPVPLDQWSHSPKDPPCNASEPGNGVDTEKEGERERERPPALKAQTVRDRTMY